MRQNIELLPCPFCGSPGEIREASWTGLSYANCSNKGCLIQPTTYSIDKLPDKFSAAEKACINAWNTRF